jgi:hypothetical protein
MSAELVGKNAEGKKLFGRHRRRYKYNIKMYLEGIERGGVWTGLIWLRMGTNGEPV